MCNKNIKEDENKLKVHLKSEQSKNVINKIKNFFNHDRKLRQESRKEAFGNLDSDKFREATKSLKGILEETEQENHLRKIVRYKLPNEQNKTNNRSKK